MRLSSALIFLLIGYVADGYKILIIHPTPSFSHQQPVMILTEALIKRGHELFVVSPNVVPGLEKKYTYVDVSDSYKFFSPEEDTPEGGLDLQKQMTKWAFWNQILSYIQIPVYQFKSEAFKKFQRRVKEERVVFDVILSEGFFLPFSCAMSRYLTGGKPIITLTTFSSDYIAEENLGSKIHLSYVPSVMDPYTDRMSLWQKIDTWFSALVLWSSYKTETEKVAREFFTETYGASAGALVDGCWTNASLAMLSSNFLYYYPRQLSPNIIELGPMHIRTPEKLPQNLQNWLDGAEKGVIYFSLGSNMKTKSLPLEVRANFLRVFKELPAGYRVLWKWEMDGKIPGQSDNILTQKWFPQQSVLAHPKVRLFVTQGGLQSFQEAVHYGVPTVGIPYFADQESDVAKMVTAGIGVRLRPQDLVYYEEIKAAINEALFNETYTTNMKRLSAISHDFTPGSIERAMFWVEHVARHGGAAHLRPSTADTTPFQYFCLDILCALLLFVLTTLYVIMAVIKCLISSFLLRPYYKIKSS